MPNLSLANLAPNESHFRCSPPYGQSISAAANLPCGVGLGDRPNWRGAALGGTRTCHQRRRFGFLPGGGRNAGLRIQLLNPIQSLRVPLREEFRLQTCTFQSGGRYFFT